MIPEARCATLDVPAPPPSLRVEGRDEGIRVEIRVVEVPLAGLRPGESRRAGGLDAAHVHALVGCAGQWPAILVHRASMQVMDGAHRVAAAKQLGHPTIAVQFCDGTLAQTYLEALTRNVHHGLPLSAAERRAAVARVLATHPQLPDREIARCAGVSPSVVARSRGEAAPAGCADAPAHTHSVDAGGPPVTAERATDSDSAVSQGRVGRDGRVYPTTSPRAAVVQYLSNHPGESLREVGKALGVAPATVKAVKDQVRADRQAADEGTVREATVGPASPHESPGCDVASGSDPDRTGDEKAPAPSPCQRSASTIDDPRDLLRRLRADPSLSRREDGRRLFLPLHQTHAALEALHAINDMQAAIPDHRRQDVANLLRYYSHNLHDLAQSITTARPASP